MFIDHYNHFKNLVSETYPDTRIVIENRAMSQYHKGDFLITDDKDIHKLLKKIKDDQIDLYLMLDIPQLFTSLGGIDNLTMNDIEEAFHLFEDYKELIIGIHIWGRDRQSHRGDLDSLFNDDTEMKEEFLEFISEYLNDGHPRYLIPEVNFSSQEIFNSIIEDLREYFIFL